MKEFYWLTRKYQKGGPAMSQEAQQFLQALQQDPENAPQLIAEALQNGGEQIVAEVAQYVPEVKKLAEQVIAQLQNPAQEEQTAMAKCGAKLKKVKKASCGKKLELGNLLVKKASKGCGCKKVLHRQGGKIIEICE